jgi:hypothetical protein
MATENRLWGAERIRGELLKLGIPVCKRTLQKYMRTVRTHQPRGQRWATFLHHHAAQIWACDALSGHRSLLSTALCVLHHRTHVTEGDPRRRDTISHRFLGRAYRSEKPPRMGKHRSISFVITRANLGLALLAWRPRVRLRFSKRPFMRNAPMRSANAI